MRGKVSFGVVEDILDRITPAYAGKSWEYVLVYKLDRDHPRLCGEKNDTSRTSPSTSGSPPPMRGKVLKTMPKQKHCRITPAYAGKRKNNFVNVD